MHEAAPRSPEGIVNLSRILADSADENECKELSRLPVPW